MTAPTRPETKSPVRLPKEEPHSIRALRLARAGRRRPHPRPPVNPLREGLRLEQVPDPAAFVLFGATGDLAHRKVFPALYQLWRSNLLPHEFAIVANGRREYDDESFRKEVRASLEAHSRLPVDPASADDLLARITYHQGDFADDEAFTRLAERLDEIDARCGTRGNRLFYLATQPSAFPLVVAQLGRVGLDHEVAGGGWRRIVIEKPFGHDLESARRLNFGSSASRRSTGSTTTWARRPSGTSSCSGSGTGSSSRSGIGATSTTSRSRSPNRSASRAGGPSTRRPERAGTSSRTTSSSSSRW
jgi:hypothetical protein